MFRNQDCRCLLMRFVLVAILAMVVNSGCGMSGELLETVDQVDLEQYAGRWYEIARYENNFERNCTGVTAEYSLRSDGRVDVVNTCYKGSLDGRVDRIEGVARAVDSSNAKLKVQFFWPFEGDYWILELGEAYDYAVVSEPGRNFLWILSRSPQMDPDLYEEILDRLEQSGFDTDLLIEVEQAEAETLEG